MIDKYFSDTFDNLSVIQKEFDSYQNDLFTQRQPEFFCLELCGEAGELANLEKKAWKGREISKNDLAEEAADVFIALMNYCNSRQINLANSLEEKLAVIESKRLQLKNEGKEY